MSKAMSVGSVLCAFVSSFSAASFVVDAYMGWHRPVALSIALALLGAVAAYTWCWIAIGLWLEGSNR